MSPEARAREILDYLATNEVAGTPHIIHEELKLFRDATWSVDTTERRLKDYHAVGYLDFIEDVGRGHGWYHINADGRDAHSEGLTDTHLRLIIGRTDDSYTPV